MIEDDYAARNVDTGTTSNRNASSESAAAVASRSAVPTEGQIADDDAIRDIGCPHVAPKIRLERDSAALGIAAAAPGAAAAADGLVGDKDTIGYAQGNLAFFIDAAAKDRAAVAASSSRAADGLVAGEGTLRHGEKRGLGDRERSIENGDAATFARAARAADSSLAADGLVVQKRTAGDGSGGNSPKIEAGEDTAPFAFAAVGAIATGSTNGPVAYQGTVGQVQGRVVSADDGSPEPTASGLTRGSDSARCLVIDKGRVRDGQST